jgi:hypothetical protein
MVKLLAGSLWAIYNMGGPAERCTRFIERSQPAFRHLIDGVLFADQVIVPTQDFMSLAVMTTHLGERKVIALLESGCLGFVRFPAALSYAGNGAGLIAHEVLDPDGRKRPLSATVQESARWAVSAVGIVADPELFRLTVQHTIETDPVEAFNAIEKETYQDVIGSEELATYFTRLSRRTDLKRLPGVSSNEGRIYGGPDADWRGDDIDILLALATTNLELWLAQSVGCENSASSSPVRHLLRAKIERIGGRPAASAFARIREIVDVPDIADAVICGDLDLAKLLKLRNSRAGEDFRVWLNSLDTDDPITIAREYIALLRAVPVTQSLPVRLIRYVIATVAGLVPPVGLIAGPVASAVDSFLVDRLFAKRSARIFIDELATFSNFRQRER